VTETSVSLFPMGGIENIRNYGGVFISPILTFANRAILLFSNIKTKTKVKQREEQIVYFFLDYNPIKDKKKRNEINS
jgi:hypothetical protein